MNLIGPINDIVAQIAALGLVFVACVIFTWMVLR
jgi:hypothetical protein